MYGTLNCIKFLMILTAIIYYWFETDVRGEIQMTAVHELSQLNVLPLTYHHDVAFTNISKNSNLTEEEKMNNKLYQQMMEQEKIIEEKAYLSGELNFTLNEDGTRKSMEQIQADRSSMVPVVFWEVLEYEYMDKTCLLLIVFCIIWQQGRKINNALEDHGVVNSNKVAGHGGDIT